MNMWDERYSSQEYAYGTEPNAFLASLNWEQIHPTPTAGKRVLSLAEGEGRNAVYLARQGFDVTAVDSSNVGLKKAQQLARNQQVALHTQQADLLHYPLAENTWDGIVCFYGHFPTELCSNLFPSSVKALKNGGFFIMEVFSQKQIHYASGGPKDPSLLYNLDELRHLLTGLEFSIANEVIVDLKQGSFHNGLASVIQILGFK